MPAQIVSGPLIEGEIVATPGGAMLVASMYLPEFGESMFEISRWRADRAAVAVSGGRGGVHVVTAPGGSAWVLRHYRRGGLFGRVVTDSYLFTGAERTRAFREWRLLADLVALGLPAPRPVAARFRRTGPVYRADLVTELIPDCRPLSALLCDASIGVDWEAIGATIRDFHDAGVDHADLNAHNVLVDDDGRVFLVDFDRGRRRSPGSWRQANLSRLRRSLDKLARQRGEPADETAWRRLLAGYSSPGAPAAA